MIIELALSLAIRQTNNRVPQAVANEYASMVVEEANKRGVDPWLFHGLIYIESRWTASAVRTEDNHTCSVGLGQINIGQCVPGKIKKLLDPKVNIERMGEHLEKIRSTCKYGCDGIEWLRAYNPGNKKYVARVKAVIERFRTALDADKSDRRSIHAVVLPPRLYGYSENNNGYNGRSKAGVDCSL